MAWIYFPGSGELALPSNNGSGQSPTVRSIDIVKPSSYHEWKMAISLSHQSGTMSQRSKGIIYHRKSILSTQDSLARISAVQDMESAWKASEAAFFSRSLGLHGRFDRNSFSWRTSQRLLFEDLIESVVNFPRSGMIVDGTCYELMMWERRIDEKGGFVWPTPTECGNYATPREGSKEGTELATAVRMWPTPTQTDAKAGGYGVGIRRWEKWKTMRLCTAVRIFPTPRASDAKDYGPVHSHSHMKERRYLCADVKEENKPTGRLNPTWVEWLMNYPLGWTELKPWAMRLFPRKCPKPSND